MCWLPAQMQAMDFEGLFAYKLIIPAFTWGSILSTFLGPFLFPAAWFSFVAVFMVTFVLVSLSQARLPLLCAFSSCSACGLRALFLSQPSCVLTRAPRAALAYGVDYKPHQAHGGARCASDACLRGGAPVSWLSLHTTQHCCCTSAPAAAPLQWGHPLPCY